MPVPTEKRFLINGGEIEGPAMAQGYREQRLALYRRWLADLDLPEDAGPTALVEWWTQQYR